MSVGSLAYLPTACQLNTMVCGEMAVVRRGESGRGFVRRNKTTNKVNVLYIHTYICKSMYACCTTAEHKWELSTIEQK